MPVKQRRPEHTHTPDSLDRPMDEEDSEWSETRRMMEHISNQETQNYPLLDGPQDQDDNISTDHSVAIVSRLIYITYYLFV
jgi:hypothetical protein